jgi:hypothetical protein
MIGNVVEKAKVKVSTPRDRGRAVRSGHGILEHHGRTAKRGIQGRTKIGYGQQAPAVAVEVFLNPTASVSSVGGDTLDEHPRI